MTVQNGKNVTGDWIRAKCYVLRVTVLDKVSKMRKVRFAGVECFAPLAGPANAGEKSMEPETKTYVQRLSKVSGWCPNMVLL